MRGRDADDRSVEVEEAFLGRDRGDFRPPAAQARILLHRDQAARLAHGVEDRDGVQGNEAAEVDDRGLDAVLGRKTVRGLNRLGDHGGQGGDGDVAALADHLGGPEPVHVLAVGDLALGRHHELVLEEDDGIGIADRGRHQALDVGRVDGATTLRPGTAIAQFSTLCECCAPKLPPPPLAVRMTRGSETWPPVM